MADDLVNIGDIGGVIVLVSSLILLTLLNILAFNVSVGTIS